MRNANQDPGLLKQDPDSTINGGFPGVWEIASGVSVARAQRPRELYPQVIHRILTREFGEFELPKPMG